MRVLYLAYSGLMGGKAFSSQFIQEAKKLKENGIDIFILTFESFHYTKDKRLKSIKKGFKREKIPFSISYLIPKLVPLGRLTFSPFFWRDLLATLLFVLFKKVEILHAHNEYSVYIGIILKKFLKLPLIFDMHGISEQVLYRGERGDEYNYKRRKEIERKGVKEADYVFCVSDVFKQHLVCEYNKEASRIIVTRSSVDTELFHIERKEDLKRELGLQDRLIIAYSGTVKKWQILDKIIGFFIQLKKKTKAHLLILTPDKKEALVLLKDSLKDDAFTIIEAPHEEVPRYLGLADFGLLLREDSLINRVASPVKFCEYLACGVPVVVTRGIGDTEELIKRYKIGVIIDGLNKQDFDKGVDEILRLLKGDVNALRKNCRKIAIEYFSFKKCIEQFMEVYKSLEGAGKCRISKR